MNTKTRKPSTYVGEVYRGADDWRWRITAANGRIVANGGEPFARRDGAVGAIRRLVGANVVIESGAKK